MHAIWNDLGYAWRRLRRSPGFTLTVVLTLALGVGANAIVFSVLNALILQPLPVPDAGQLVSFNRMGNTGSMYSSTPAQSYPDYRDLRDTNRTFSGLAAYAINRGGIRAANSLDRSWFYEVSENYFDMLGVQPELGRFFHPSDAHGPNSSPYVVLSHAYWQRRFHSDPHVVGRVIELNKHPLTVLGVAPESFTGTERFFSGDFWVSMLNEEQVEGYSYLEWRGNHQIWVLGRMKPGVTVAQAEADINTAAAHMAKVNLQDENLRFHLSRPGLLGDMLGKPVQAFLWGLMALAALVLLAACANLGSLFAARAADGARELALRLSLGAGRMDLLRQLVTEAVLVSLIGGVAGLVLARAMLHALSVWRLSPEFPVRLVAAADARVSLLALLLAVASGVFFGLIPARQVWRENSYLVVKSGTAAGPGRRRPTLRDVLLVVQIVVCSVLLTASLVAVRGLGRSLHTSYGFEPKGALLASFDLQMSGHGGGGSLELRHRAMDAIAALPGVTEVGFTNKIPLNLSSSDTNVYREGTTDFRDSNAAADASNYAVSPGYLAAAQTRILAGRDFTWHDDEHAPLVAVVNGTFARKVFGTTNPVGRYFTRSGPRIEVIGLVEDGKYNTLTEDPSPAMFLPMAQDPTSETVMVVRSRAGEAATAAAVHDILAGIDPDLPVAIGSWQQAMGIELFPSVAATVALGVMGGLAAMLAVTGIFGMASYAVSRRLRELGLRVALGAGRGQVLQAALGRPARLLLFGSAAGLALGMLASRLLAHIVYGATSQDPVVLLGVVASMALLALAATWLPARRALQVDPATLLREE